MRRRRHLLSRWYRPVIINIPINAPVNLIYRNKFKLKPKSLYNFYKVYIGHIRMHNLYKLKTYDMNIVFMKKVIEIKKIFLIFNFLHAILKRELHSHPHKALLL